MTAFVVPHPVGGTATGWAVVDFLDATYTSPPATTTGGSMTITLPQLDQAVMWSLTHMVAMCNSTLLTRLRLYLDAVSPARLRDGTDTGNFDVADWPGGLIVPPSSSLVAQWTGADAGAVGTLTVQGQIMRQVG